MEIKHHFSLKKYNTFGIEAKAKQFVAVQSLVDLKNILEENKTQKKIHFGGGRKNPLTKKKKSTVNSN